MAKLTRWLLLPLFIVALLLCAAGYWLLHQSWPVTYAASRLQQAFAALEIDGVQGTLARGISVDSLRWQEGDTRTQIVGLELTLRLSCWVRLELCVESLQADSVSVQLAADAGDKAPTALPVPLPEITLPLPVSIDQLQVQSLAIAAGDTTQQFTDLSLRARWLLRKLELEALALNYLPSDQPGPWRLTGAGQVRFFRDYPLALRAQLATATPLGTLTVLAEGNLRKLTAEGAFQGDWPLAFKASAEPLTTPVPWTLALQLAEKGLAVPDAGSIQLQRSKAQITGTGKELKASLESVLRLPYWPGENRLKTSVTLRGNELVATDLLVALPQGKISGQAQLQLGENFAGVTGQGDYQLLGNLQFVGLNPALFLQDAVPALKGQLDGGLSLQMATHNQEGTPALSQYSVQLETLTGTLLERPVAAQGEMAWHQDKGGSVRNASVQQGSNRVVLRQSWQQGQPLSIALSLTQLETLSDLVPGALSGAVEGTLDVQVPDTLAAWQALPRGQGKLQVQALTYDDLSVGQAEVQLSTSERQPYSVKVQASVLRYQEQSVDRFTLAIRGDEDAFALSAEAATPNYGELRMQCQGDAIQRITTDPTSVVCERIRWQPLPSWPLKPWENLADVHWTLNLPEQTFALQPLCVQELRDELTPHPRLCVDQPFSWQRGTAALSARASGLSWTQIQPLLNGQWQVRGRLSGELQAQVENSQLQRFGASLDSDDTEFQMPLGDRQVFIPVQELHADIQGNLATAQLNLRLDAGDYGTVEGDLQIDRQRQLQGSLTVRDFEVRTLQPFLTDVTQLAGVANGQLALSGSIDQPAVNGEAEIHQGIVHHLLLPEPLTHVQLQTRFDTHQASFSGSLSLLQSPARFGGELDWQSQPVQGWLTFAADDMQFSPMPQTTLWLAPDIRADYRDGRIAVTGNVRVPRAFINIKSLPENSVGVSPDVVIVDAEISDSESVAVDAAVTLMLGDAVRFRGFGLETRLKGTMRLDYSPQQLLQGNGYVQLLDGTYRAYGQNLAIRSGELIFVGPLDNPTIYVEAIRADIPESVTVGIRAEGHAQSPRVALFSQPAMSDQARLHYLIIGQAPGEGGRQDSGALLSQAAVSLGAATGETALQDYADKLGIQNFQISAAEGENGAEVQVSGYVNPRLYVRYGMGMFEKVNSLTMRYRLRRNLFLEAVSSTASTLDLLWTFQVGENDAELPRAKASE